MYDQNTLLACDEDDEETAEASYVAQDEWTEDNFIDSLREQGDDDACLIADFEETAVEMLQDDADLATAYSAYQEVRARLSEKFRNRGFWPSSRGSNNTSKGKGSSFNQKGSSKGKRVQPRRSLQDLRRKRCSLFSLVPKGSHKFQLHMLFMSVYEVK